MLRHESPSLFGAPSSNSGWLSVLLCSGLMASPTWAYAQDETAQEDRSQAYGGSLFDAEALGVSAGFHRWLGRAGTHYADCVGATLLVAVDDPWMGNHFTFGGVFATAVGEYGDADSESLMAAAASTTEYIDEGRSYGGSAALPPLPYSYSTLAARAGYRLHTDRFISAGAYIDLGYGLVGTADDSQIHGFAAAGSNLIIKVFPSLIWTLGLQYRHDIPAGERLTGFEEMSTVAVYNSIEVVKF